MTEKFVQIIVSLYNIPRREDTSSTAGTPIIDKNRIICTGKIVSQVEVETEWLNKGVTSTLGNYVLGSREEDGIGYRQGSL